MSDGNTATISPIVQESEMSHVRQIFDKAANAIVQASELAKQVNDLTAQFNALRQDMEYVRLRNKELDEMLATVRTQRDEAKASLLQVSNDLGNAQHAVQTLTMSNEAKDSELNHLRSELEHARKDRDESYKIADAYSKDLDLANAQLDEIRAFAQRFVQPVPKPEPTADQVVVTSPVPAAMPSEVPMPYPHDDMHF